MARIGIMSMQRILNYGSSLQAYSLRRLIEGLNPSAEVTFVDYMPGTPLVGSSTSAIGWGRALRKFAEYSEIDAPLPEKLRFMNHKRGYARRNFPLVGIPAARDHDTEVDLQIIGSDEVFNCVQSNVSVGYARDLFGHRSRARKLVSYAGSFGNTTLQQIEDHGLRTELEHDFLGFDSISVRDLNSAAIVEKLVGTRPPIHVDPALAYDLMNLEDRIPQQRVYDAKYLLVYGYPGRISASENAALKSYAQKMGLKILAAGGVQDCADRFIECNPFELLAYFRDAEAVVTDTFHGTIFSIINQTPFVTLIRPTVADGYGNEEKLGFLLETFGLASRRLTDLAHLDDLFATRVDFEAVGQILELERVRAVDYLHQCARLAGVLQ